MFARSPCSLSSFLIVFIWFDGGSTAEGLRPVVVRAGQVRQRDCGRSRFVGGLAAGRGPALLLERHGAAQIRTVIRIADLCSGSELKGAHEKQTFICTCIWVNLRLIDIALFPVASALRWCALTFRPAATERSTAPLAGLMT